MRRNGEFLNTICSALPVRSHTNWQKKPKSVQKSEWVPLSKKTKEGQIMKCTLAKERVSKNRVEKGSQRVHTANEDRWESNINGWFPYMYSQKWNCFFQNRIIMFCLPVPTLIRYIFKRFISFQDRSAYFAAGKYVDRPWEYINHSQIHGCGNWDRGRAIPRKGIHKWDFPCSVGPPGEREKKDDE